MMFDPTKPVQTRYGRSVRILCSDVKSNHKQIVALVTNKNGIEAPYSFHSDGQYFTGGDNSSIHDLVNIPEREVRYVNLETKPVLNGKNMRIDSLVSRKEDHYVKDWSTLRLIFEDGKLISSEVIR